MEVSKEIIKKKIKEFGSIKEVLFYLDVVEKEVNDRISELYLKTRMDEIGFFLADENGWQFDFEYREFNPEFMLTPPLTKEQQKQYLEDFGSEIKEAEHLHNIDYYIKDQKKFYEKQLVKYTLMENGEKKIETENGGIQINIDCYNFDFNKIKKYAENLDPNKATLYLKYVLKEFDREKRENYILYWTQDDIEYLSKNFIIDDLSKLEQPPNLEDLGRSARISLAKENFEKNVLNEITFIEEKIKMTRKDTTSNKIISKLNKNNADENKFQEYLERGTKYYLKHKHTRLSFIEFYDEMKRYFGDDLGLCEKVFYRIINDVPVIRIFGYDMEDVKRRIDRCGNEDELNKLIEVEKRKTEELLKAIHDYKLDYYVKWEKSYKQDVDEDWLEQQGYTDEKDLPFDMHYNGWLKYYLEDIQNVNLIEMLKYGFTGRLGDFDNINDKNAVKIYLDDIESELKKFKDEIVQAYVLKNAKLIQKPTDKIKVQRQKKKWNKNKSEFARFVNETYDKERNKYKSLRDANNKLFEEYEFEDKNWTKEKCYDLVRQT